MWKHLLSIVVAFGLLLGAPVDTLVAEDPVPASPTGKASTAETALPAVEMVDMSAELADLATWAMGLFEQADLDLPPMRFVAHGDDTSSCRGRAGTHRHDGEVSVIDLCTVEASPATQVLVLHEAAHAWAAHELSDERRDEFQQLRGWEHWRDYEAAAWHENGTEQAAEIIVWGLIDRPVQISRISRAGCDDLAAGYLALTGSDPLNGHRDHC